MVIAMSYFRGQEEDYFYFFFSFISGIFSVNRCLLSASDAVS